MILVSLVVGWLCAPCGAFVAPRPNARPALRARPAPLVVRAALLDSLAATVLPRARTVLVRVAQPLLTNRLKSIAVVGLVGGLSSRRTRKAKPGKLILVRHGESLWNANKTFTGWVDVDLSPQGEREIEHAARLLLERGFTVDVVYTSVLKRAIRSSWIMLRELGQSFRPVKKRWQLNERHYGALQGLSKTGLAERLGHDVVYRWRAGYDAQPPPIPIDHPLSPMRERKYASVDVNKIPLTESLHECLQRTLPVWEDEIQADLKRGFDVVVVAHGNSIRGLVKAIDKLNATQIEQVGIPNGIPLVYEFSRHPKTDELVPIRQQATEEEDDDERTPSSRVRPSPHLSGEFLEEKGLLREALKREAENSVLGGQVQARAPATMLSPMEKSLTVLNAERSLMITKEQALAEQMLVAEMEELTTAEALTMEEAVLADPDEMDEHHGKTRRRRSVRPSKAGLPPPPPMLVIIRHGKTEHNKLGLFTGWEDAGLAPEGREQASVAGKLLAKHGVEIDVCYTSWLSRAIETAWLVLTPLDSLWVTLHKSWRLNERMYGSLTGLSKRMIKQRHGEAQFNKWRRSYDTRPPPASPFSAHYPGNDERYVKYIQDMPFSLLQSLIRSLGGTWRLVLLLFPGDINKKPLLRRAILKMIGHGKLEMHRRMPRSESLRDCMERTIPYFKDVILPESIKKNRTVLVASSENAIRGLLMYLCDVPQSRIHEIEIPTGIPLIYDFEGRCIHLLDDGMMPPPRDRYDFGTGADLLFQPCQSNPELCDVASIDPHIRLDDRFFDDRISLSQPRTYFAERERNELIHSYGEDDDEFSVERRAGWGDPNDDSAVFYDEDEPEYEI